LDERSAWSRRLDAHIISSLREPPRRCSTASFIEIETCRRCGGKLEVIASIEDAALIERILAHLEQRKETEQPRSPFAARGPPQSPLF
jgi:hypothetical protein